MNKSHNKELGKKGEDEACLFLEKQGYKILERNYRYSKMSEIDIIAKDKDTIVFVEVKTRTSTNFGHPLEAINHNKLNNIFQASLKYLQTTNEQHKKHRIDIISIIGNDCSKIEHLKNISLN